MRRSLLFACALVTTLYTSQSFAITDLDKFIDKIGVARNSFYFSVVGGFTANCRDGVISLLHTDPQAKATYGQLLVAKALNLPLSRIVYTQTASGEPCLLTLLEIRD